MPNGRNPEVDRDEPTFYQIRIEGHLGPQWGDYFGGP